ncbi:hypothetical protein ACQY1Q_11570 [Tenacibaculum sp. TC6]|uniref:hypothetical protein n=1 Tax=Tenacibaculum sp. TC6 TaxID=3423223 RepID=UPI003D36AD11
MKFFKKLAVLSSALFLAMSLNSCSGCDNENPRARVNNNGADKVSVQIKTTGGNTENINNIDPGNSSSYTSYAPGEITYTIVLKDNSEVVKTVNMAFCTDYEISIDQNNVITTKSTPRD